MEYIFSYNPNNRIFTRFDQSYTYNASVGYHKTGALDTKRNHFLIVGNGSVYRSDLNLGTNLKNIPLNTSGGNTFLNTNYPGISYDPNLDRYVGWNGGNLVYLLNPDTLVWETMNIPGAPRALQNGTYKRFSYVPSLNAYVYYGSVDENAYLLKLY